MTSSLPPPPARGQGADGGTSWGRGADEVDSHARIVTDRLPNVEGVSLSNDTFGHHPDENGAGIRPVSTNRDQDAKDRAEHLAAIRAPGDWPPPTEPARHARPGELPAPANAMRKAAADPWQTSSWYAPAGAVPYAFERKRGGYLRTDLAYVRFAHPDGRRAVAVWVRDQLAERGRAGAKSWGLHWSYAEGWRWRSGPNGTFPRAIGATALKAAVTDPTWRANPYTIEEAA